MTETRGTPRRRVWLISLISWSAVCALHVAGTASDQLRRGTPMDLGTLASDYALAYVPWMVYTALLFPAMEGARARLSEPRILGKLLVLSLACFLPLQVVWQVGLSIRPAADPMRVLLPTLRAWPLLFWLIDVMLMVGSFGAVFALVSVREGRALRAREQALQAERVALSLEREQHRVRRIRAQLEPHFLFNALSAIAGLVRSGDQAVAIEAIGRLSAQLRYAIAAIQQEWSTIGDEVDFVRGYLALQALRFPDRLEVQIEVDDAVTDLPCPPLLLQPLIENAIRHDLECHAGPSTLQLTATPGTAGAHITVRNPLRPIAQANPGLGLGLTATRERLALAYGGAARFAAGPVDGHFVVSLVLPTTTSDA